MLAATRADAGWHASQQTTKDSGVSIDFSSPINSLPFEGCMPCWVTIKNRSGAARTWSIRSAEQNRLDGNNVRRLSSQSVRVENDATVRAPVLLPLSTVPRSESYYRPTVLQVDGYGVEEASASLPALGGTGKKPTPFIGLGETLATPLWEPLKKDFDGRGIDLAGSPVEPGLLGDDWRELSGFDCLWLTDGEYAALEAGPRTAIRRWINQGGALYLCAQTLDPTLRAGLGLPATGAEAHPGFGFVKLIPWDGKTLPQADAVAALDGLQPLRQGDDDNDTSHWRMIQSLGAIPLNAPFLIGFILLFAILVGPVNLFWLADATRRHRLFWTTPLISLAASLLLLLVIVLQDGFGGRGERTTVTLLCPDQKEAVVVQEQAARSGVLLSRQFTVSEDLVFSSLKVGRFTDKSYDQADRHYGGDWFTSRSVQAQRAEAIVPSRADIQLLNAPAADAGAPPVVVSSVPAALTEIRYLAPSGKRWRGGPLRTGEQITLQPDSSSPEHDATPGSALLTRLQQQVQERPGFFYARADGGPFIDTLPSIRWNKQQAVYLGPVSVAR